MNWLKGWWSAWKYVAILGLLLGLSMWGNLHQYVASKTAPLRAMNKDLAETLNTVRGMSRQYNRDSEANAKRIQGIADQRVKRETIYRQAAAIPMAANCAPGKARMDAVNQGIK